MIAKAWMTLGGISGIVGLAGMTLLAVALILNIFVVRFFPKWVRWTLLTVTLIAAFMPINGLAAITYFRALTGDMSMTTTILCALFAYMQLHDKTPVKVSTLSALCGLIIVGASFLYPLELGLTIYTPYTLGYGSNLFFAALLLITLIAWKFENHLIVLCILTASAAYLLNLLESRNLWDYLIDPVCTLFSIVFLLIQLGRLALRKLKSDPLAA